VGGASCLVGSNPTLSAVAETVDSPTLEIDRVLPAPVQDVFAAFTEPARLRAWWGPQGFSVPSVEFEPRVGESYRIEMQPPEGEAFHLSGVFREVDPLSRLAFTFNWEPPDADDVETVVALSFSDAGGSTEVALSQGAFRTVERRDLHRDGWTDSFDKLEAILSEAG
jgi:uncharacterized protein YndB with AHSA1/START domain